MKRRKFAILSGVGLVAIAVPSWIYTQRIPEYDPVLKEPIHLSSFLDDQAIYLIGDRYRELFPDENGEKRLVQTLFNQSSPATAMNIETIQRTIAKDFQTGNTVMIDGWILSRTEARQCALLSLTSNQ